MNKTAETGDRTPERHQNFQLVYDESNVEGSELGLAIDKPGQVTIK